VTTDINATNCELDAPPPSAFPDIEDSLIIELKDTQDIFALTIGVNKTAETGGIGLLYHDSSLGLLSLGVRGKVDDYADADGKINYTIKTPGTVKVKWREGKTKDHVTLVCVYGDTVTVNIAK